MCEAKPGPRCSNDTAKEWTGLHASAKDLKIKADEAHQNLRTAEDYHRYTQTPESATLVAQWQAYSDHMEKEAKKLAFKENQAMLSYYSTPGGFTRLEETINTLKGKTRIVRDGFMLDDGDWANVTYYENKSANEEAYLHHGTIYRDKQKEAAKQLKDAENNMHKVAYVDGLLERTRKEEAVLMDYRRKLNERIPALLEKCVEERNSASSTAALKHAKQSLFVADVAKSYTGMFIADLEQAKRKLPEVQMVFDN